MSLFGSLLGDFDDDAIFGQHMRQMRQMNSLMNMGSLMPDPFNMLTPFDNGMQMQRNGMQRNNGLFGFPGIPNMNRLLNSSDLGTSGASFCSSSVISMSSGPDGRPQVYQETRSTKTGPGGVRETRKTVEDSRTGVKKMAIGHHIGERAHIIEREQNYRSGQHEEHQEYINLDEEEAEDFDREFTHKVRGVNAPQMIHSSGHYSPRSHQQRSLPAIAAPPSASNDMKTSSNLATNSSPSTLSSPLSSSSSSSPSSASRRQLQKLRRPLRTPSSSPLALTSQSISIHSHPYNASTVRRNLRAKHKQHSKQLKADHQDDK